MNKKVLLITLLIIINFVALAKAGPISKIQSLKKRSSKLSDSQVYDELIKIKKTINKEYEFHKKLKETSGEEISIMHGIKWVLTLVEVNANKTINCSTLKNSIMVDFKYDWNDMPEGIKLIWPLIERCCEKEKPRENQKQKSVKK